MPTAAEAAASAAGWRPRLGGGRLAVVTLDRTPAALRDGYSMHPLELDLARPPRLLRRAVAAARRWSPLAAAAWPWALPRVLDEVLLEIRAGDPDLVDLRRAPARRALGAAVARAMPPVHVLTEGEPPAALPDWRRYDPGLTVSVVLPVYDGARYLEAALASILGQTHRSLEVVVVDDASRDATPAIVEAFARRDRRVVAVRNASNLRLPGALNVGFARARGALLTWTSHDNLYEPDAIEALVRYLCTWPEVDFVYSAYRLLDEDGRPAAQPTYLSPPWRLRDWNPVGPYFLYRRAVWETLGRFRPDMEFMEDYEYWARAARRFHLARLHLPRYAYRRHPGSMSNRAQEVETRRRRIQAEHFGAGAAGGGRR